MRAQVGLIPPPSLLSALYTDLLPLLPAVHPKMLPLPDSRQLLRPSPLCSPAATTASTGPSRIADTNPFGRNLGATVKATLGPKIGCPTSFPSKQAVATFVCIETSSATIKYAKSMYEDHQIGSAITQLQNQDNNMWYPVMKRNCPGFRINAYRFSEISDW